MNKKIYNKPSVKVIELEGYNILAGSNDPQALDINDEEVDYQDSNTQRGFQW